MDSVKFREQIKSDFLEFFPDSFFAMVYSDRLGKTYHVNFSLGKDKSQYSHGIFENDPMCHKALIFFQNVPNKPLSFEPCGIGGLRNKDRKMLAFPRKKQGTEEQVRKHLKRYFEKLKALVQEHNIKV